MAAHATATRVVRTSSARTARWRPRPSPATRSAGRPTSSTVWTLQRHEHSSVNSSPFRRSHSVTRALKALTAVLAVGIVFAPALAFVLGERGKPTENREPAAFTGLDDGWDSLTSFGGYVG